MTKKEAREILDLMINLDNKKPIPNRDLVIEAIRMAIEALEIHTPCDLCVYNPPSRYGKPCTCCPAEPYKEDGI